MKGELEEGVRRRNAFTRKERTFGLAYSFPTLAGIFLLSLNLQRPNEGRDHFLVDEWIDHKLDKLWT